LGLIEQMLVWVSASVDSSVKVGVRNCWCYGYYRY